MIDVGAVITNCDTPEETERCIEKLLEHSGSALTNIVVVDDASTVRLPSLPSEVALVQHDERKGYPASVNHGVAEALNCDLLLLLDSDAYPLTDLVSRAANYFQQRPGLGAAGMRLVDSDGRPTGSFSREPHLFGFVLGQKMEAVLKRFRERLGWGRVVLYSCGVALRRRAFLEIGGFDNDYRFLDADIDFFLRLQDEGWDVEVCDALVAFHEGGGSPGADESRVVQFHRARWKLLRDHGKIRWPRLTSLFLVGRHIVEVIVLGLLYMTRIDRTEISKIRDRRALVRGAVDGDLYGLYG